MKKLIMMLLGVVFTLQVSAQDDAISKFMEKYTEDTSFTVINVSSRMFSLFAEIDAEDPDDKEAMEAISKLEGLKILALEDASRANTVYKEAFDLIPSKDYEELMTVRSNDMNLKFMIKEANNKISELLMIGGGDDDFFMMSLVGDIDIGQISKLSGKMDIDGFDNFKHLDKDKEKKEEYRKG